MSIQSLGHGVKSLGKCERMVSSFAHHHTVAHCCLVDEVQFRSSHGRPSSNAELEWHEVQTNAQFLAAGSVSFLHRRFFECVLQQNDQRHRHLDQCLFQASLLALAMPVSDASLSASTPVNVPQHNVLMNA